MASPTSNGTGAPTAAPIWRRALFRAPLLGRFGSFVLVGGSGVLVNNAVLFLLYQEARLPLAAASVVSTALAIVNNFVWNDRWTFRQDRFSLKRLLRFGVVSVVGLGITVLVLLVLVTRARIDYRLANLAGIGLATVWNFAANVIWTWGGQS